MSNTGKQPQVTADEARALLERAEQVGATATAGASWPQIALLMVLGASSSMAMVALGLVTDHAGRTATIAVMATFLVWLAIALAGSIGFGRSTKRGFSGRWRAAMIIWAVLWVMGIVLGSTVFAGNLVWFFSIAGGITIATATGALAEAQR